MRKSSRRNFLLTTAAAGMASTVGAKPFNVNARDNKIVHHVFFWLKNEGSVEDRDKLVEGVKSLSKIPLIKELQVGIVADTQKRDVVDTSWAVSELMFFETLSDQANYQNHPIHQEFIKNYSALWSKVVVYDILEV